MISGDACRDYVMNPIKETPRRPVSWLFTLMDGSISVRGDSEWSESSLTKQRLVIYLFVITVVYIYIYKTKIKNQIPPE